MKNCEDQSDVTIQLRGKNKVQFKAGADLSGNVNIANVNVIQEQTDQQDVFELHLSLNQKQCVSHGTK